MSLWLLGCPQDPSYVLVTPWMSLGSLRHPYGSLDVPQDPSDVPMAPWMSLWLLRHPYDLLDVPGTSRMSVEPLEHPRVPLDVPSVPLTCPPCPQEVDIGLAADVGTLQRLPKIVGSQRWVEGDTRGGLVAGEGTPG